MDRFLPMSPQDLQERAWGYIDFLLLSGDAYVDHPSFGAAVIGRVLEADGYRVAMLPQPDSKNPMALKAMGRPRLGVLITSGNLDSMVAHYTVAKRRREKDSFSPGGRPGLRPDYACLAYTRLARQAFGAIPVILGGLEASLRRFAHYDYWQDKVQESLLVSSQADILVYGMGENTIRSVARRLQSGHPVWKIRDVRGTCVLTSSAPGNAVECPAWEEVMADKRAYATALKQQYEQQDPVRGRAVCQRHGDRYVLQNPPALPLTTEELDASAALPYTRAWHPSYDAAGGVPALEEVRFSLIHNRGCFGGCHFCSLHFHQGRMISVRSHDSLVQEAQSITKLPGFKGHIHDVGGPTANFRHNACKKQAKHGACVNRACLTPEPCPHLDADHSDFVSLLHKLRQVEGVKNVFVRSGLRYDYLLLDPRQEALRTITRHHVSGRLKVAPEHCVDSVLAVMGKPPFAVYRQFVDVFDTLNKRYGLTQYLVPYLISSHPGCTLRDAITLAQTLKEMNCRPEQVQDFYPTPGTLSTGAYYTGLHPLTLTPLYIPRSPHEKAQQRALLQWYRPDKQALVREALHKAGRADLIGWGRHCLAPPAAGHKHKTAQAPKTPPQKVRKKKR